MCGRGMKNRVGAASVVVFSPPNAFSPEDRGYQTLLRRSFWAVVTRQELITT